MTRAGAGHPSRPRGWREDGEILLQRWAALFLPAPSPCGGLLSPIWWLVCQIWASRMGRWRLGTGQTPGRFRVDLDAGGAPVPLSLLRAGRASRSVPLLLLPSPGEILGLAGRTAMALWRLGPPWRRRSREGEVVVSRQGAWWRRRCSALRDGGYGGDEVAPLQSFSGSSSCSALGNRPVVDGCVLWHGSYVGAIGSPLRQGSGRLDLEPCFSPCRSGPLCLHL